MAGVVLETQAPQRRPKLCLTRLPVQAVTGRELCVARFVLLRTAERP